jgi:hypothetical protein
MKKMIYTIAFGLLSVSVMAVHPLSDLRLNVYGNTLFTVAFDGRHYPYPDTRYELRDITPGQHFLEVFKAGGYYGNSVLFAGYIHIPASSVVNARIDRYGRFIVNHITPKFIPPVVCQPAPVCAPVSAPAFYPMSDYEFGLLRESIRSKSFESTRLQVARQAIDSRRLTSYQVRELMELMWFESSKLELAKFAYSRVIDKERFFLVNDAFSFSSSIDELDRFIRGFWG